MNILIIRVSSLGDVVLNMPMVADIWHHYPDAKIDWVVEEAYVDLVRLNAYVHHVIPFALRRWRKNCLRFDTLIEIGAFYRRLREETYDFIFDTQGLLKTGVVMGMARLAKGGKRVGLANATHGAGYEALSRIFHTDSVPVDSYIHAVKRARTVAATALNYELTALADFALQAPHLVAQPAWLPHQSYVVFFHGTSDAAKQWPVSHWIQVAQNLNERGFLILLPWGNIKEKQAAESMAVHMAQAQVLPALTLPEIVILVQHATLVVGLDTGLTHIAAAYCRPTIELYCDSPRWQAEGNWSPCITNLGDKGKLPTIEEVLQAVEAILI